MANEDALVSAPPLMTWAYPSSSRELQRLASETPWLAPRSTPQADLSVSLTSARPASAWLVRALILPRNPGLQRRDQTQQPLHQDTMRPLRTCDVRNPAHDDSSLPATNKHRESI